MARVDASDQCRGVIWRGAALMAANHVGCMHTAASGEANKVVEERRIGMCQNRWSCMVLMRNWTDMDLRPSWTRMTIRMKGVHKRLFDTL